MADLDDLDKVLQEIAGLVGRLSDVVVDMSDKMDSIEEATKGSGSAVSAGRGGGAATGSQKGGGGGAASGRPGAPSKGGGAPSGGLSNLLKGLNVHPAAGVLAAGGKAAGILKGAAGAGIVSASRGGDFTAGFETQLNKALGSIPIVGEATGVAGAARIEGNVTSRLAKGVGDIEAIAGTGAIPDETLKFVTKELFGQEQRRESGQERARLEVQKYARDNPDAVGNRLRVSTTDMMFATGGLAGFVLRQMYESAGLGQHK